jgi:hypothetical protein
MPFQGTQDASDIMVKHVPQEPSSPRTKTSGKPSHHQSEITMEPELEGGPLMTSNFLGCLQDLLLSKFLLMMLLIMPMSFYEHENVSYV